MADDHREIADLLFGYAERIDLGDFAGVAELLGEAELSFDGFDATRHGRHEILALFTATTVRHGDGTPRTKHVITNVVVDLDPSTPTATARSYFTVLQAVPESLPLQPVAAGRYHDRFGRGADGRWRFTARHVCLDLIGDVGQHLTIDPGGRARADGSEGAPGAAG